jgi:hypothetical protein
MFARQGHYAADPKILASYPPADISIDRMGELFNYDLKTSLRAADATDGLAALG